MIRIGLALLVFSILTMLAVDHFVPLDCGDRRVGVAFRLSLFGALGAGLFLVGGMVGLTGLPAF